MSFDIYLQRFRNGSSASVDPGLVLDVVGASLHRREYGYDLEAADGGCCSMQASGLDGREAFTDCSCFLHGGWTPELLDLIFAAAKAGDMVIIPVMAPIRFILTAPEQREHLPVTKDWAEPVLCSSGEELGVLMASGYEVWRRYRDYVVHGQSDAQA